MEPIIERELESSASPANALDDLMAYVGREKCEDETVAWYERQALSLLVLRPESYKHVRFQNEPFVKMNPKKFYYAVTLRCNNRIIAKSHLDKAVDMFLCCFAKVKIIKIAYECVGLNLHAHFTIKLNHKIRSYVGINIGYGWHRVIKAITDMDGWDAYISKQCWSALQAKLVCKRHAEDVFKHCEEAGKLML